MLSTSREASGGEVVLSPPPSGEVDCDTMVGGTRGDAQEMRAEPIAATATSRETLMPAGVVAAPPTTIGSDTAADWAPATLTALVVHLATGCGYTLAIVWQDSIHVSATSAGEATAVASPSFSHPFIQTWILMLGQTLLIPLTLSMHWWSSSRFAPKRATEMTQADDHDRHRDGGGDGGDDVENVDDATHPIENNSDAVTGLAPSPPRSGVLTLLRDALFCWFGHGTSSGSGSSRGQALKAQQDARWILACLVVAALLDTCQGAMSIVSLTLIDPSVYSMLRMSQLLFATMLQLFVLPWLVPAVELFVLHREHTDRASLRVVFTRLQFVGLLFVVVGVGVVFHASTMESAAAASAAAAAAADRKERTTLEVVCGGLLVLFAVIILSVEMAIQEYIVRRFSLVLGPAEMVGVQGVFAASFAFLLVLVVNSPAPPSSSAGNGGGGGLMHDHLGQFFLQIWYGGWTPITSVFVLIVCIAALDATGTYLAKHMTANIRPAVQPMRSLIIWVVGLRIGASGFSWERLIGFVICVLGAAIFKRMITF